MIEKKMSKSLIERIKQILKFPPAGKSRELWRAMDITEAVITLNSYGKVELTTYDECYRQSMPTKLFDFKEVLKILEEETQKDMINNFDDLAIQAKTLGFNYVDLYIPDKQSDELIAFTFSKSEEYSKIIQDVEIGKVVISKVKIQELADMLNYRVHPLGQLRGDLMKQKYEKWFEGFEKKFVEVFGDTKKGDKKTMKCPIKDCSEDCKQCDGNSTSWIEDGEVKECVYVTVWKIRKSSVPQRTSPYKELK